MNTNVNQTAVLTLDFQQGLLGFVPQAEQAVPKAAHVLELARREQARVIHVGLGFEPGHPEIAECGSIFGQIRQHGLFLKGSESAGFLPTLARPEELKIYKQRFSAFSDNTLEMVLRAHGIKHLVLMGLTTSGIVLSTLRRAFDLDFSCTVVADACYDGDEEVHRVLTEKVFTAQARVVQAADFGFDA